MPPAVWGQPPRGQVRSIVERCRLKNEKGNQKSNVPQYESRQRAAHPGATEEVAIPGRSRAAERVENNCVGIANQRGALDSVRTVSVEDEKKNAGRYHRKEDQREKQKANPGKG